MIHNLANKMEIPLRKYMDNSNRITNINYDFYYNSEVYSLKVIVNYTYINNDYIVDKQFQSNLYIFIYTNAVLSLSTILSILKTGLKSKSAHYTYRMILFWCNIIISRGETY